MFEVASGNDEVGWLVDGGVVVVNDPPLPIELLDGPDEFGIDEFGDPNPGGGDDGKFG